MTSEISFTLDGERLSGVPGDTVAAALLRERVTTFTRSIKYHRPRGPFCLAGTCGQCLLRIDGVPSLLACRLPLQEGMHCERQNGPLGMEADILRASDFLFPRHLDHHHLLVHSRLAGRVALEIARRLAGLGELPDEVRPPDRGSLLHAQVVVIGGGPAGIAAARAAAAEGARALLVERSARLGGAALLAMDAEAPDPAWVAREAEHLTGVEVLLEGEAVGLYPNDTGAAEESRSAHTQAASKPRNRDAPALIALRRRQSLLALVAERVIVATGGVSQPLPFAGVDRPGVYAARGLLALARATGVRVGSRLCVVGEGAELLRCARALQTAGYALARVVDASGGWPLASGPVAPEPAGGLPLLRARDLRARGNPVRELRADSERIACDAVAVALPPAPLHELASAAGAQSRFSAELNGFAVAVDGSGRTRVPWLFAAGSVTGAAGIDAPRSGATAGAAAARSLEEG